MGVLPNWVGFGASEVHVFRLFFRKMGLAAFFLLSTELIVHNPVNLGLAMAICYQDCNEALSISSIMLVILSKFVLPLRCKDYKTRPKIKR